MFSHPSSLNQPWFAFGASAQPTSQQQQPITAAPIQHPLMMSWPMMTTQQQQHQSMITTRNNTTTNNEEYQSLFSSLNFMDDLSNNLNHNNSNNNNMTLTTTSGTSSSRLPLGSLLPMIIDEVNSEEMDKFMDFAQADCIISPFPELPFGDEFLFGGGNHHLSTMLATPTLSSIIIPESSGPLKRARPEVDIETYFNQGDDDDNDDDDDEEEEDDNDFHSEDGSDYEEHDDSFISLQKSDVSSSDLLLNNSSSSSSSRSASKNNNGVLNILEGLNYKADSQERQRGGRGNTQPLPRHVISIERNLLDVSHQNETLRMACLLKGYDKSKKSNTTITELKSVKVESNASTVSLIDLIVQQTTQSHCRKPFTVVFSLQTMDGIELSRCETSPFQTITKRGDEKRAHKKVRKIESSIDRVHPNIFPHKGDTLTRIYFDFIPKVKLSDIRVSFGETHSRVYAIVQDQRFIICEVPPSSQTSRNHQIVIRVSFDKGKTFISSKAQGTYTV